MLKQITTGVIIFSISILMLIFTLVPHHHHHDSLPCFNIENLFEHNAICGHDGDCDNHRSCCGHHQHESDSEQEKTCILDQMEFIAVGDQKSVNIRAFYLHLHKYSLPVFLTGYISGLLPPEKVWAFLQPPPYLINYHSVFAGRNMSLRAPPF